MRALLDTATWDDDLSGLGPEEGDPANGEEISVIGDKLASRTRYLLERVDGGLRLADLNYGYSTPDALLTVVSTTTYVTVRDISTTVDVLAGDVLEVSSQVHLYRLVLPGIGDQGVELAHRWDSNPGGSPSYHVVPAYHRAQLIGVDIQALPVTVTDFIPVSGGMVGYPATLMLMARLTAAETSEHRVNGPLCASVKVWRPNGTL